MHFRHKGLSTFNLKNERGQLNCLLLLSLIYTEYSFVSTFLNLFKLAYVTLQILISCFSWSTISRWSSRAMQVVTLSKAEKALDNRKGSLGCNIDNNYPIENSKLAEARFIMLAAKPLQKHVSKGICKASLIALTFFPSNVNN
jgi:hypothetical protein